MKHYRKTETIERITRPHSRVEIKGKIKKQDKQLLLLQYSALLSGLPVGDAAV